MLWIILGSLAWLGLSLLAMKKEYPWDSPGVGWLMIIFLADFWAGVLAGYFMG